MLSNSVQSSTVTNKRGPSKKMNKRIGQATQRAGIAELLDFSTNSDEMTDSMHNRSDFNQMRFSINRSRFNDNQAKDSMSISINDSLNMQEWVSLNEGQRHHLLNKQMLKTAIPSYR